MQKLPTNIAEKVYDVLTKFAEAKPDYYSREVFIFHFGVIHDTSDSFKFECMDDAQRTFTCRNNGTMWLDGKCSDRVNAILRKISSELHPKKQLGEFTITTNAV